MSLLPEPLPPDPLPLLNEWLNDAHANSRQPNPNVLALATVGPEQMPAVRMVLSKELDLGSGYLVFYTNYRSAKARHLDYQPRVAGVFHWDALGRQARIEGIAIRSPAEESDRYFASRDVESRLGAWASDQSAPVASRSDLLQSLEDVRKRFDGAPNDQIPRPPGWGGYRLWIDAVELWVSAAGRMHDRGLWQRQLSPAGPGPEYSATGWSATRLQP